MSVTVVETTPAGDDDQGADVAVAMAAGIAAATADQAATAAAEATATAEAAADTAQVAVEIASSASDSAWDAQAAYGDLAARLEALEAGPAVAEEEAEVEDLAPPATESTPASEGDDQGDDKPADDKPAGKAKKAHWWWG